METKKSPTPWKLNKAPFNSSASDGVYAIQDAKGLTITTDAYFYDQAPLIEDAAFIVRACNAHDDLVKALGTAIVMLEPYIVKDLSEPSRFFNCSPNTVALENLKATYAKASGQA